MYKEQKEHYINITVLNPNSISGNGAGEEFYHSSVGAKIVMDIYMLAKPTSGTEKIEPQTIGFVYSSPEQYNDTKLKANAHIDGFTISSVPKTCSITSQDPHTINMNTVNIQDFSGNDEVYGGETSINLTCSSGLTVYAGMSDITKPNNQTSELTLESSSTSSGFAVRLYHDTDDLISYYPNTTKNTWLLSSNNISGDNTYYNVPLIAKYYKNNSKITPGTVFSKAKITFIYQ